MGILEGMGYKVVVMVDCGGGCGCETCFQDGVNEHSGFAVLENLYLIRRIVFTAACQPLAPPSLKSLNLTTTS